MWNIPYQFHWTAARSRESELNRITRRKLVKTNNSLGNPRARGIRCPQSRLNRDRAIPQTGRFEPSDKRCNNSAPVFHHATFLSLSLFLYLSLSLSPRIFIPALSLVDCRRSPTRPSRETLCLQDKQESFACKSQRWRRLEDQLAGGREDGILITEILPKTASNCIRNRWTFGECATRCYSGFRI